MITLREKTEQWKNFVNNFIFANFKNFEIWMVEREVSDNNMLFNYIRFPKAENGKKLNLSLINFMVQSFEADEDVCKKIFGPAYEKGTAEVQEDSNDISIIWNKRNALDLINFDEDEPSNDKEIEYLYEWDINEDKHQKEEAEKYRPKRLDELTPEEIKRREKINKILRLMAIQLKNPTISPENSDPENLEKNYLKYAWEETDYWDNIDNEQYLKKYLTRKYNSETGRYALYNPITLKWFNELTGNWVEKLPKPKKSKWY